MYIAFRQFVFTYIDFVFALPKFENSCDLEGGRTSNSLTNK